MCDVVACVCGELKLGSIRVKLGGLSLLYIVFMSLALFHFLIDFFCPILLLYGHLFLLLVFKRF